ncbi:hypothetical protein, partial [Prevotella pallens]
MQVNLHIITLFYTLYNKGVNSVASICGLQKHEEKNEKKIAKYLVVPNICILSLWLSRSLSLGLALSL